MKTQNNKTYHRQRQRTEAYERELERRASAWALFLHRAHLKCGQCIAMLFYRNLIRDTQNFSRIKRLMLKICKPKSFVVDAL